MKITELALQEYGPVGSRAMGAGNFGDLVNFFQGPRRSANLVLDFGNGNTAVLTLADVDAVADFYNTLPDMQAKHDFVYGVMARYDRFIAMARKLNLSMPALKSPNQPDLFERKKKSQSDLDRSSVRDPKLAVALRQAYSRYPSAASDIEAFIRQELEATADAERNFGVQNKTNARQDQTIDQLRDLARRQSQRITALDKENDELDDELNRISKEIATMDKQVAGEKPDEPAKAPEPSKSQAAAGPAPGVEAPTTTGVDKRRANKEKRQTQPAAKPAAPSLKYKTTLPSVQPKVPSTPAQAPAPVPQTIGRDQPDQGELDLEPQAKSDNVTYMFGEPVELPGDQSQTGSLPAQLTRSVAPRTGTMGENLSRLKHLAGL